MDVEYYKIELSYSLRSINTMVAQKTLILQNIKYKKLFI